MKNNKKSKFVNKLFLYGILVSLLLVALPVYSAQQAETNGYNPYNVEDVRGFIGMITAIVFLIFSLMTFWLIAFIFKKLAFKKCGNEKILYYYQPLVGIGICLHFLVGWAFGYSALSLYILPVLKNSSEVTLIFSTSLGILAILCLNYLQYVTLVLTDKRALFYTPFFGSKQMFLKDVKDCYRDERSIVLIDKAGDRLGFYNNPKKDADKFYQLLTDNLKNRIDNE